MFKITIWYLFYILNQIETKIEQSKISVTDLISHFREKCKICSHHRIMHNELGQCEGVMNKPCTSGCDKFEAEWY